MKLIWPPQRIKSRSLVTIPLALSVIFLLILLTLGLPFGRDFKGGTLLMVRDVKTVPDVNYVKFQVENITGSIVDVKLVYNGFDIETDALEGNSENLIKNMLFYQFGVLENSIIIGSLGPTVSSAQTVQILAFVVGAVITIGVVIFIFRKKIAAATALVTAGLDIIGILGLMALFRVSLSLISILGIFITLGYVIDTNTFLVSRLLKGVGGNLRENIGETMKVGLVMSAVALAILLSINILTTTSQIDELTFAVIFGIVVNVVNTWFLSSVIILRHIERKKVVSYHVSV